MIPDKIFIRCHSFWRNDLYQPLFGAFPGVILFGAMRAEAFGEKNLEKLVLECKVGLFVHGLGLLAVEPQTKGLERTLQATCEGAAPSESPIPLRSIRL